MIDGLPYSGAVRANGMVFVGGVNDTLTGKSELVPGGIEAEAKQAFAHSGEILELAGSSLDNVVKCVVLLADINNLPRLNDVFREVFPNEPPTRSTIIVPAIAMGAAIEIDCAATAGD